jgi:ribosomal protein S18 acetylase RimI-like enzyme
MKDIIYKPYENLLTLLGAYGENDLVGIIRVVGDGHSIVYIQDIIVRPNHQRNGIGSILLLKKVLSMYSHVYQKKYPRE